MWGRLQGGGGKFSVRSGNARAFALVKRYELSFCNIAASDGDRFYGSPVPWCLGVFDLGAGVDLFRRADASDVHSVGLVPDISIRNGARRPAIGAVRLHL